MSLKAERVINVKAFHKDKEVDDLLGWCWRPVKEYNKEVGWVDTGKQEKLFGRVDSYGYMTHMSYTRDTHHHSDWNEWLDSAVERHDPPLDKWYFDAGGNGYPIYVEIPEMKRAMIELGLYKTNPRDLSGSDDIRKYEVEFTIPIAPGQYGNKHYAQYKGTYSELHEFTRAMSSRGIAIITREIK